MVLYGLALAAFTLYPMPDNAAHFCGSHHIQPQLVPLASIFDISHEGLRAVLQVVMNVIFFVPLGAFFAGDVPGALVDGGGDWPYDVGGD